MSISEDLNSRVASLLAERQRIDVRRTAIERELADCVAAARVFGVTLEQSLPRSARDRFTVRTIVIQKLREAGPAGTTAAEIRRACGPAHPKTVGMTLFRLAKEGVCQRVGTRAWVIQNPETH